MPEPKYNREDYLKQASSNENAEDLVFHLEEIRNRIVSSSLVLIFAILLCFYFSDQMIRVLISVVPQGAKFFQLKPGELFMVSLKTSVYAGFTLSLPVLLYQLEAFLKPGLKESEYKILSPIIKLISPLFFVGIIFAYFIILPALLDFFLDFHQNLVERLYGLEHLINLELSILAISGLSFELPIIILVFGRMGLINKNFLFKHWRYAIMFALILSAILTPTPDPVTMSLLAFALLFLYFGSAMLL